MEQKLVKKIITFSILGLVLIGMAISLSLLVQAKIKDGKINNFAEKIKEYEDIFEQYSMTDDQEDDYKDLIEDSEEIIDNKKVKKIKNLLEDISELEDEISEENAARIETHLKELQEQDLSRAYKEELEEIDALKAEIKKYITKKQYLKADKKINQLEEQVKVITTVHDNLQIAVEQVDTSEYPNIKLYLHIKDKATGEVPPQLNQSFFYLSERLSGNSDYIKKEIQKVVQLDQKESLNINMVADVSGSMDGDPLNRAKSVMINFLENVQFGIGDKVELTAFSDGVYTVIDFITDKKAIINQVNYLNTGDMTSLYDALFTAVNRTAVQNGAKCIIAFTDGMDNNSRCTPQEVIEVANRYRIPIFIIGIGMSTNEYDLRNITESTRGFYSNINNISDMSEIYKNIYRQQKELYVLEYEITDPANTFDSRNIVIDLQTREIGGQYTFDYEPKILVAASNQAAGISDIDDLVGQYLRGFVSAINSHNFSYLENYVVPDGPLYKEVKPYIQKDIKEKLLSYEIIDKVNKDNSTCVVTVHETYEVQNQEEPLHMRVLEAKYVLKKQANGSWQFYAFGEKIKIISKINS